MKRNGLFTSLNLHFAGLAVVLILDIFLGIRIALAWSAIRSDQSSGFAQEQIRYQQLKAQMQHLNGLPKKVQVADADAQKFYDQRIAPNYSTLVAQILETAEKNEVRLARSEYGPRPAISGLTEVQIDAGLSGQYTGLMHFINDLERDRNHVFFIVDGVAFTGQQGGLVNLRLRLTTYIRAGATDLPPAAPEAAGDNKAAVGEGAR